jgi:cysteine desulfuration protein SufE
LKVLNYFLSLQKLARRPKTMNIQEIEQQFIEDFNYFSSWEEKYEYIIELSKELPLLDPIHKTDVRLIKGCQSRVWLHFDYKDGKMYFFADSDAIITKGLIALFIRIFSAQTPKDIAASSFEFIEKIGLQSHLSPTRANGLRSMAEQIKAYAQTLLTKEEPEFVPLFFPALTVSGKRELENQIIAVLQTIFDPEIPVDIYALGLIYQIHISDAAAVVLEMTLTSPNCPVAESLPQDVKNKISSIDEVSDVEVKIVFDPAWNKEMMSEEAKFELGFL